MDNSLLDIEQTGTDVFSACSKESALLIYCIMQGLEKDEESRISVPAYQFLYLVTAETSRNGHFITLVLDCLFYASR